LFCLWKGGGGEREKKGLSQKKAFDNATVRGRRFSEGEKGEVHALFFREKSGRDSHGNEGKERRSCLRQSGAVETRREETRETIILGEKRKEICVAEERVVPPPSYKYHEKGRKEMSPCPLRKGEGGKKKEVREKKGHSNN